MRAIEARAPSLCLCGAAAKKLSHCCVFCFSGMSRSLSACPFCFRVPPFSHQLPSPAPLIALRKLIAAQAGGVSQLILLCLLGVTARAQYRFDHWTAGKGLPQNPVRDIVQTRDGCGWRRALDWRGLTVCVSPFFSPRRRVC